MQAQHQEQKDPNKIVFAYDHKDFRYNTSFYRAKMTKNKIAKHEIFNLFQKMYQRLNGFSDLKEVSASIMRSLIIAFSSVIIGLFLCIYGYLIIRNIRLVYCGLFLVVGGLVFGTGRRIRCLKNKKDAIQRTRDKILDFLKAQAATFEKKNIKWRLPSSNFDWIELEIENKNGVEVNHSLPKEEIIASHYEKMSSPTEHTILDMNETSSYHAS